MIYIYDDGIHNHGVLMRAVIELCNFLPVHLCTADMIINKNCLSDARLLIMPGGADLYYCEKLNGKGNMMIKDYVVKGGSYLGPCAGAYYGCRSIDWDNGAITGSRELNFFSGQATGPIKAWVENGDSTLSWHYAATIDTATDSFAVHYNGGPVFDEPTGDNEHVIARYSALKDAPPAITHARHGAGQVILSSPHIERFGAGFKDNLYHHNNRSYERERHVAEILLPYEKKQKDFFHFILKMLIKPYA